MLIDRSCENISIKRQAELAGISRSSVYYTPVPVSKEDLITMNLIDMTYTDCPYYGKRRIRAILNNKYFIPIGIKHTRTLMQNMGLEAIYPKKKGLSNPGKGHKIYPYLLRGLNIERPNQVWSTDITYIRLANGFCYLVAIIDWYSRYVVGWRLSNTLEIDFCLEVYEDAIKNFGCPDIMNSDQGSHFTSPKFINISKGNNIKVSMDGRGRCLDNIFVERLWRSVKQEKIYRFDYKNVLETKIALGEYFPYYNNERPHQSLDYIYPAEKYF